MPPMKAGLGLCPNCQEAFVEGELHHCPVFVRPLQKCPDCGFTGGHSPQCSWHDNRAAQTPAPVQKMMRVVLANGTYFDIGPLPAGFNFQAAMNSIRLSGAWLSDNLYIEKPQIGAVFCFDQGAAPPSINQKPDWTAETGDTPQ